MNAKEKHVYLFSELDQAEAYAKDGWDSVRGLLGGKDDGRHKLNQEEWPLVVVCQ